MTNDEPATGGDATGAIAPESPNRTALNEKLAQLTAGRDAEARIMPDAEYRALEGINYSSVKLFLQDPQLYYETYVARTRPPREVTPAIQFGKDLEAFMFYGAEPGLVIPDEVLNGDGHRKGTPWKNWRDAMVAQFGPDVALLTRDEYLKKMAPLMQAREQVLAHPLARTLLWHPSTLRHVVVTFVDPVSGQLGKVQLDALNLELEVICDLKATMAITRDAWGKQVLNLGYHLQAEWYRRAVRAAFGVDCRWTWVAVKNSPSYHVETYVPTAAWFELAAARVDAGVVGLTRAADEGRWQTDTHGRLVEIEPPAWAWTSFELE